MKSCLLLLLWLCAVVAHAAEPVDHLQWTQLPSLPQALGGQLAGVSGDALLVVGGSSFVVPPFEGGVKNWHDTVYVLAGKSQTWRAVLRLEHPLAYGAAITVDDSVIIIGGASGTQHFSEVFRLRWVGQRLEKAALPALPHPLAYHGAALLGRTIYVFGGQLSPTATQAQAQLYALELDVQPLQWQTRVAMPGAPRILPVVVTQNKALYVFGGAELFAAATGQATRRYLNDAWRYQPASGWQRVADLPHALVAATGLAHKSDQVLVLSGDDGANAARIQDLKHNHPGFSRAVLTYHTGANTWEKLGSMPESLVTTSIVKWRNRFIIAGGEDRPGHRSAKVWAGTIRRTR